MSADRPVRAPNSTDEPPDVDSLMSRLDGQADGERASDPDPQRPSAAELLGGSRRRSKRGIRVPDDAVPAAGPPPSSRRNSAPPPPVASVLSPNTLPSGNIAPSTPLVMPVQIPAMPVAPPIPQPSAQIMPPASQSEPNIPVVPAAPLTPMLDTPAPEATNAVPAAPIEPAVRIQPQRMIIVGGSNEPPRRRSERPPAPTAAAVAAEPPPPAPAPAPAATPSAPSGGALKKPTMPNLDATVREALALLDREDFEGGTVDIPVNVGDDEDTNPNARAVDARGIPKAAGPAPVITEAAGPISEEALSDEEVEVVSRPDDRPRPAVKVHSAPTPPPRKSGPPKAAAATSDPPGRLVQTLPSANIPQITEGHSSQPKIVVAAAATATAPISSSAPVPASGASSTPTATDSTGEVRRKKRQWYEEMFNDDYARATPKLSAKYLEREVEFIDDSLGCDKGAAILDLGCGPGEHSVALAKRGYEVIGVDLSLAMLARAADEAAEKQQRINFLQGDMRDLTFEEAFDGIFCWGTTFGYFDDAKNAEVIQRVHRALRRGGRFLLDVANRDYIVGRSPSMVWFEGEGCVCMDEVMVNGITSRLQVKRTMMMEDGRQREIDYSIRLYALHELGKLLHDNGFRVAEASGDTSTPGVYFGAESPRILILAEKR